MAGARALRWLGTLAWGARSGGAGGGTAWAAPRPATRPPESRDRLIDRLAELVADAGLIAPAVLLAESQRPLLFVYGQLAHFVSPCLDPLLGLPLARDAGDLLSDRTNLDRFLDRLEELGRQR